MNCTRHEGWVKGMEAICADDIARRELLWLRAQQKEDEGSLRSLARIDPDLPRRMAWAHARFESWRPMLQWSCDPSDAWGRIYDVCFDWHVTRLTGKPLCDCADCQWMRAGVHWRHEPARSHDGR